MSEAMDEHRRRIRDLRIELSKLQSEMAFGGGPINYIELRDRIEEVRRELGVLGVVLDPVMTQPAVENLGLMGHREVAKLGRWTRKAEEAFDDRAKVYGNVGPCFETIAKLWSTYLGTTITPKEVAILNMLQKIARDSCGDEIHEDNFVDVIGYALCIQDMNTWRTLDEGD